jgi:hypothetical protein
LVVHKLIEPEPKFFSPECALNLSLRIPVSTENHDRFQISCDKLSPKASTEAEYIIRIPSVESCLAIFDSADYWRISREVMNPYFRSLFWNEKFDTKKVLSGERLFCFFDESFKNELKKEFDAPNGFNPYSPKSKLAMSYIKIYFPFEQMKYKNEFNYILNCIFGVINNGFEYAICMQYKTAIVFLKLPQYLKFDIDLEINCFVERLDNIIREIIIASDFYSSDLKKKINEFISYLNEMKQKQRFEHEEICRLHGSLVYYEIISLYLKKNLTRIKTKERKCLHNFMLDMLLDEVNQKGLAVNVCRNILYKRRR